MKVCTNCHLSFPDSASHCTQCGAPLTTVADQPPVYSGDPLDHTAEFDPLTFPQTRCSRSFHILWDGSA